MLFLLFHIGTDRYALEASRVVEVLPLLELTEIPQAPPGLAGLLNYRGQSVPTVDLNRLAQKSPASPKYSTRIILVRCNRPSAAPQLVGLIAQRATEILRKEPHEFVQTGISTVGTPLLGPVLMDPAGPIQWINEEKLLTNDVRQLVLDLASPLPP
jgi:chemotaxis-related protein WspB